MVLRELRYDTILGGMFALLLEQSLWERPASGAPLLSRFGNLSIRKILVVTSAYICTDSGGGGGESQDNPTGGGECHLFLAGNRVVLVGNRVFLGGKSHDHRHFCKRGFFKKLKFI